MSEKRRCKPCEGYTEPLTKEEATALLFQIEQWTLNEEATEMHRTFKFKNYYETMTFVNAIAWISHQQDHHPDLEVGYNRCLVRYTTHAIKGLSENDFICAIEVDALLNPL